MTIKQLLDKANEGYPDCFLSQYYDKTGKPKKATGDGLAEFIVNELIETFDPGIDSEGQLSTAYLKLEAAKSDLDSVILCLLDVTHGPL